MTFECYSPQEIRFHYERAKNKREIIRVLADLTCSTEAELVDFLGVEFRHRGAHGSSQSHCVSSRGYRAC